MALNTVGKASSLPIPYDNEIFLLERNHVGIEIDIKDLGRFRAKNGRIILTTLRIVFVRDEEDSRSSTSDNFRSFEIPIAYISKEQFVQPIFGANYLEGDVEPFQCGPSRFYIYFNHGGVHTFLKMLSKLISVHRKGSMASDSSFVNQAKTGDIARGAFVDPSDPSTVFMTQPKEVEMTTIRRRKGDTSTEDNDKTTNKTTYRSYLRKRGPKTD